MGSMQPLHLLALGNKRQALSRTTAVSMQVFENSNAARNTFDLFTLRRMTEQKKSI